MAKKGVPVAVPDHEDGATFTLKAAKVETKQVGGGTKLVNCLFAYCAGNEFHNFSDGVSGTSNQLGPFGFHNFSNGTNCTTTQIGTFVYTNCY